MRTSGTLSLENFNMTMTPTQTQTSAFHHLSRPLAALNVTQNETTEKFSIPQTNKLLLLN